MVRQPKSSLYALSTACYIAAARAAGPPTRTIPFALPLITALPELHVTASVASVADSTTELALSCSDTPCLNIGACIGAGWAPCPYGDGLKVYRQGPSTIEVHLTESFRTLDVTCNVANNTADCVATSMATGTYFFAEPQSNINTFKMTDMSAQRIPVTLTAGVEKMKLNDTYGVNIPVTTVTSTNGVARWTPLPPVNSNDSLGLKAQMGLMGCLGVVATAVGMLL